MCLISRKKAVVYKLTTRIQKTESVQHKAMPNL